MSKFVGDDGFECSANSRRWECLISLVAQLSQETTARSAKGFEDPFITHFQYQDLDLKNKGKRSPRKKKVVWSARVLTVRESSRSKKPPKIRMDSEKKVDAIKKRAKKRSNPASDLPEALKKCILDHGCDLKSVVLITQKVLTMTDVSKGHGKLSVRYSQIRNKFLKQTEVDELDKDKGEVRVILIQPCLEECEISLRNWKSNLEYVLIQDWNKVCKRNALSQGMKIQLWSFRRNLDSQLCFVLVKVV